MGVSQRLVFLGTNAGKPSKTRNASSLALILDGSTWLFDVAEGTQRQALEASAFRLGSVNKLFITHMHGDHCLGLVPLLLTMGETVVPNQAPVESQALDIYGPSGVRELIRTTFRLIAANETRPFRIHELLYKDEPSTMQSISPALSELAHGSSDIRPSSDGFFDLFTEKDYTVRAGPIKHTIPCLGYMIQEAATRRSLGVHERSLVEKNAVALQEQKIKPMSLLGRLQREQKPIPLPDGSVLEPPPFARPGRKVVILGDTYDATAMLPISQGADVVVHESTNAFLPETDPESDPNATLDTVRDRAASRGHSVPEVAAHFAKEAQAVRLVMNHISPKYTSPRDGARPDLQRLYQSIYDEIQRRAQQAWGPGAGEVVVAEDFTTIDIPRREEEGRVQ